MKTLFVPVFAFILLLGLSSISSPKKDLSIKNSIEGTWELTGHYLYNDNLISDTIAPTLGYRQIKMYHKGKVMWTRYVPKDSTEWFGYGSYDIKDGKLIETLEYGSASMMEIIDTMRVFTFDLELQKNNFSQILSDAEGNRSTSENYKRIN